MGFCGGETAEDKLGYLVVGLQQKGNDAAPEARPRHVALKTGVGKVRQHQRVDAQRQLEQHVLGLGVSEVFLPGDGSR